MVNEYKKSNKESLIGIITQSMLANIYDGKKRLLYRVKLTFEPESKSCFQKFCESCCENEVKEEERDYNTFLIKRLVKKEEQIEDVIIKKDVQEIVGKMENYPLKITFPEDASPKDKILLIICRIFLLYMMNFSVTFRERCTDFICEGIADELKDDSTLLEAVTGIDNPFDKFDLANEMFSGALTKGRYKNAVQI